MDIINITELKTKLESFAKARDWEKFHNPKNIAMALSAESGELLEIFQWLTPEESAAIKHNSHEFTRVQHEIADIVLYAVLLCHVLGINLQESLQQKFAINDQKYPPALVKGSAKKPVST